MVALSTILGESPVRSRPFPGWPRVTEASRAAVLDALDSGHWWQSGQGKAEAFESWLASYQHTEAAVAVTNGTHALEVAFRALSIGPGDEVLVPALTFISSASAVTTVGARAIPVDVTDDTLCIDVTDARRKRTSRTKAVMPVHLAGQPADMDAVGAFAAETGLAVVEDAAQAIGAEWRGQRVGGLGDVGTFSFHATKLLPAGEGGGVVTNSEPIAARVRLWANCGRARGSAGYGHELIGSNFRMTEFQAALLLSQIDGFERLLVERQALASTLTQLLLKLGTVSPPVVHPEVTRMVWYMYLIRVPEGVLAGRSNAQFAGALTAEGIPASPIYPAFHRIQPYAAVLPAYQGSCPRAERAASELVWLHHRLFLDGEEGIQDVATAVAKVCDRWRRLT